MTHRSRKLVLFASLFLGSPVAWMSGAAVAKGQTAPTADEIATRMMARNAERQAALDHYTGERIYRVEYKGTGGAHSATVGVHVDYVSGQKHLTVVSQVGSKLICDRVLRKLVEGEEEASAKANRMQTTLSPETYRLTLAGEDTLDGVGAWVLNVEPKTESKFTYRGRVWVSQSDYAIMRVLGEPARSPSFWISRASFDWRYGRKGEFWLPESNVAKSHVRLGGDATMTIEYDTYRILSAKAVQHHAEEPSGTRPEASSPVDGQHTAALVQSRLPLQ